VLKPLEVIWIMDECIRPPGPKMVVCVEGELGFFFRINTKAGWQQSVLLKKSPDHPFLDHDSHLECGDPLELDDYVIEQSLNRKGAIGAVRTTHFDPAPRRRGDRVSCHGVSASHHPDCIRLSP
jgi:hypothetical protein